jgi:hypothetical protein
MKLFKSVILWVFIVALFVGVGFLHADRPFQAPNGPEPLIAFGSVGVGIASCVIVGLFIVRKVRAKRLPRFLGAVLMLLSSGLSILAPFPIIGAASRATNYRGSDSGFHLFQGEHGMWIFVVFYGFWIALGVFALFVLWVFLPAKSKVQQSGRT